MAKAPAEGAAARAQVGVRRVPETVPEKVARKSRYKLDQDAPVASVAELGGYDAIVVGTGTRYNRMSSQMAAFLDQTGGCGSGTPLKVRSGRPSRPPPPSTAARIGLPYSFKGMSAVNEAVGRAPYGATTIADEDGSRQPSAVELDGARCQGGLVARTAIKLFS